MRKDVTMFLRDAAASLRDLALRAPDIAMNSAASPTIWTKKPSVGIDLQRTTRQNDGVSG
ncbi:MAG TPA: hypothetical protein VK850_20250 [Candidatus Binatia bacterium]|jgi:hypothetical protein|nr:hypothetical protein [Candidatus Binatia bacterium]